MLLYTQIVAYLLYCLGDLTYLGCQATGIFLLISYAGDSCNQSRPSLGDCLLRMNHRK